MKVLLVNKFLFPKGGDAISTINTGKLLKDKGHEVAFWGMVHPNNPSYSTEEYFVDNIDYLNAGGLKTKIKSAANILYSFEAKNKLNKLLGVFKPDIVHLNNFAHQISPSILHVLQQKKIPSVMTMRDYKIVCPVYTMMLNGKPCQLCKNGSYYHCAINKCTKGSRVKSLLNTVEMYLHHDFLHIYDNINTYISPSKFLAQKCKEMGMKSHIEYLCNFLYVDEYIPSFQYEEDSMVYVGRLSYEKGINTLIKAVKEMPVTLKIVGDGPLKNAIEHDIKRMPNVKLLGYKTGKELQDEIRKSMCLVIPSEWYENNPRTVIEAFALGKPVIGANIGGIPELIENKETGLLYESGNHEDLREKIDWLIRNWEKIEYMGKASRKYAEENFDASNHYEKLIGIYRHAIESN